MTGPDPAQVIAEAAAAAWQAKHGSTDWIIASAQFDSAKAAVAALEAAGLTVIPAGTPRVEWAVRCDGETVSRDDELDAREDAAELAGAVVVRRMVHVGKWTEVASRG